MRKSESRVSIRKASKFFAAFIICVFALLTACAERDNRGYDDSLISPEWYSEKTGRKSAFDFAEDYPEKSGKGCGYGYAYAPIYPLEEMVAHSSVVIRARVLGFDFIVTGTEDGASIFTDYYVEVLDVLRGNPYSNEIVTVRANGGEDNDYIYICSDFDITVGKEYIFLLWMPQTVAMNIYNDDDYYSIVDYASGYYEGSEETVKDGSGRTVPKEFKLVATGGSPEDYIPLDYLEFVEKMKEYNETIPIDENFRRKQITETYQTYIYTGYFTQEEYEESIAEFDQYGEVLYYPQPWDGSDT